MTRKKDPEENATVLPWAGTGPTGAPVVGWLVSHDDERGPVVDWPGNERGPVVARSTVGLAPAKADEAVASRRGVVLIFERDRTDLPIIVGLLVEGPTVEARLPEAPVQASVDGRRVQLSGTDEVVLRCGSASIVLRRNGRVIIRGTAIESRASGTHKIKGGSVQIN